MSFVSTESANSVVYTCTVQGSRFQGSYPYSLLSNSHFCHVHAARAKWCHFSARSNLFWRSTIWLASQSPSVDDHVQGREWFEFVCLRKAETATDQREWRVFKEFRSVSGTYVRSGYVPAGSLTQSYSNLHQRSAGGVGFVVTLERQCPFD